LLWGYLVVLFATGLAKLRRVLKLTLAVARTLPASPARLSTLAGPHPLEKLVSIVSRLLLLFVALGGLCAALGVADVVAMDPGKRVLGPVRAWSSQVVFVLDLCVAAALVGFVLGWRSFEGRPCSRVLACARTTSRKESIRPGGRNASPRASSLNAAGPVAAHATGSVRR
jgi:hypothetical protein